MPNSTKICPNKDCRKQLQPEDQYCASCGTIVPESPAFDRKYLLAIGLGFFIIGIVAGAYVSMNFLPESSASEPVNLSNESKAYMLKTWGDNNSTKENYNYNTAQDCYIKSIKINPNYKEAWLALGDIECGLKDANYSDALNYYENAALLDPYYFEAWMGMGNASYNLAEEDYEKGHNNNSIKYYNDSIKYYDQAVELSKIKIIYKGKSGAMLGLAKNYGYNLSDELREKAMESSNLSIMFNPNDPASLTTKADILHYIGREEEGNNYYDNSEILNKLLSTSNAND